MAFVVNLMRSQAQNICTAIFILCSQRVQNIRRAGSRIESFRMWLKLSTSNQTENCYRVYFQKRGRGPLRLHCSSRVLSFFSSSLYYCCGTPWQSTQQQGRFQFIVKRLPSSTTKTVTLKVCPDGSPFAASRLYPSTRSSFCCLAFYFSDCVI